MSSCFDVKSYKILKYIDRSNTKQQNIKVERKEINNLANFTCFFATWKTLA
jgi:hypothetical protein